MICVHIYGPAECAEIDLNNASLMESSVSHTELVCVSDFSHGSHFDLLKDQFTQIVFWVSLHMQIGFEISIFSVEKNGGRMWCSAVKMTNCLLIWSPKHLQGNRCFNINVMKWHITQRCGYGTYQQYVDWLVSGTFNRTETECSRTLTKLLLLAKPKHRADLVSNWSNPALCLHIVHVEEHLVQAISTFRNLQPA